MQPSRRTALALLGSASVSVSGATESSEPTGARLAHYAPVTRRELPYVSADLNMIWVDGYGSVGDGGEAWYKKVPRTPNVRSAAWQVRSSDESFDWELAADSVNPMMFGAAGDGDRDDTEAVQNAIDFVSAVLKGGNMHLANRRYKCSGVTIQAGVHVVGSLGLFDPREPRLLIEQSNSILLSHGKPIEMCQASSIRGVLIAPSGMTFPQQRDQVNQWSGTAITVKSGGHGAYIGYCNILGFNAAIVSGEAGVTEQVRIEVTNIDCHNGVHISNSPDVVYLDRVHCWPTAVQTLGHLANFRRNGTAFRFANRVDWAKATNCFSYGYSVGFELNNVADCQLVGCGVDGNPKDEAFGGIGVKIHGDTRNTRLVACQIAAQKIGLLIATSGRGQSMFTNVSSSTIWDCYGRSILLQSGNASIVDTTVRVRGSIEIGSGAGKGRIASCNFELQPTESPIVGDPRAISRFQIDSNINLQK